MKCSYICPFWTAESVGINNAFKTKELCKQKYCTSNFDCLDLKNGKSKITMLL